MIELGVLFVGGLATIYGLSIPTGTNPNARPEDIALSSLQAADMAEQQHHTFKAVSERLNSTGVDQLMT